MKNAIIYLVKTSVNDSAIDEPKIFSDDYNNFKRKEVFIDNRHDQSVFSVLRKLKVTAKIAEKTFSQN